MYLDFRPSEYQRSATGKTIAKLHTSLFYTITSSIALTPYMPNAPHPQQHGPSQGLGIHLICYPNHNMLVYQLNPKLLETAIDHTEFVCHLAAVNFNIG